MKNKELLNICYKLFNRFITVSKMIEMLDNMDKKELSKEELKKLDNLIAEIKKIDINTPNKEDEYIIKEKEIDSHKRWFNVVDYINKNDYFNTCYDNLSDYELLEFIAQNIHAPFPPKLNQDEFDRLVKVGIEKDEREWLWRLAFNYGNQNVNLDSIVDYFIKMKDAYYLSELISAIGEHLDIDSIIDKINDKDLINGLINEKQVIGFYVKEEQFNKLISKLGKTV